MRAIRRPTQGRREVVAVMPAAGFATRLGSLPWSKEVFPIPTSRRDVGESPIGLACDSLLNAFRAGRAERVFVVIRDGKWDIPGALLDGRGWGLELAYVVVPDSEGLADTVSRACPFIREATVLFGLPDILLDVQDPFGPMLQALEEKSADVALGLFPPHRPQAADMVDLDETGRVRAVLPKPRRTELEFAWILAAWKPTFTEFLHERSGSEPVDSPSRAEEGRREEYLGDVLHAAIGEGLVVVGVPFREARYLDIGTPEDLVDALGKGFRGRADG